MRHSSNTDSDYFIIIIISFDGYDLKLFNMRL